MIDAAAIRAALRPRNNTNTGPPSPAEGTLDPNDITTRPWQLHGKELRCPDTCPCCVRWQAAYDRAYRHMVALENRMATLRADLFPLKTGHDHDPAWRNPNGGREHL